MHLMHHTSSQIRIVGIRKMTGISTHHMIAGLSRDDIKEVCLASSITDIPLGGISIVRHCRNRSQHRMVTAVPRAQR